jgi:hypothetical protein
MIESRHANSSLALEASDVSGQRRFRATRVQADASVGELVSELVERMDLPRGSERGQAYTYSARLEREGRHLLPGERVGEALLEGDLVVLQPDVDAGGGAR